MGETLEATDATVAIDGTDLAETIAETVSQLTVEEPLGPGLYLPLADLPAGTVVTLTLTVTIGPAPEPAPAAEPAPAPARAYMGMGRR